MPIECLKEMIAGIDANPPSTDEEFEAAINYWREREREMRHDQGYSSLEHSLALISRAEIESILRTRKIRHGYVKRLRNYKTHPKHGKVKPKGGNGSRSPIIKEKRQQSIVKFIFRAR